MSVGRVVSSSAAVLAVVGCTALAVSMARAAERPTASSTPTPTATQTSRPAYLPDADGYDGSLIVDGNGGAEPATPSSSSPKPHPTSSAATTAATRSPHPSSSVMRSPVPPAAPAPVANDPAPVVVALPSGTSLPLSFSTGNATRVITVVAGSTSSTTAVLQAWNKAPGGGWYQWGPAVTAHVGSDGLSWHPSESISATPIGSFTLTQAFGYYGNPGTGLPYFQTTPDDYWISDEGPLYNTHQRCGGCGYDDGVNEHLYYETPYYNYAVVIDYNTRNAPGGVHPGAGSAFFLHVTDGTPTAGCVAIPQSRLVTLMRWLTPSAHPRILIGVV